MRVNFFRIRVSKKYFFNTYEQQKKHLLIFLKKIANWVVSLHVFIYSIELILNI